MQQTLANEQATTNLRSIKVVDQLDGLPLDQIKKGKNKTNHHLKHDNSAARVLDEYKLKFFLRIPTEHIERTQVINDSRWEEIESMYLTRHYNDKCLLNVFKRIETLE